MTTRTTWLEGGTPIQYGQHTINVVTTNQIRQAITKIIGKHNTDIYNLVNEAYGRGVQHGYAQGVLRNEN